MANVGYAVPTIEKLNTPHSEHILIAMRIDGNRRDEVPGIHTIKYDSEADAITMSPLAHIDRTCQTCHRQSADTLRQAVYERQRKCNEIRVRVEKALAAAHIEAKFAFDHGATEDFAENVSRAVGR